MEIDQRVYGIEKELLSRYCKDKSPVVIYIVNGVQIHGILTRFDSNVLIVDANGRENLIYKHAVSTISADIRQNFLKGTDQFAY